MIISFPNQEILKATRFSENYEITCPSKSSQSAHVWLWLPMYFHSFQYFAYSVVLTIHQRGGCVCVLLVLGSGGGVGFVWGV